jgi:hypothetical protein
MIFLLFYNDFFLFFFGAMSYEQGVFVWFNVPFITYLFLQLSPQICYVTIDLQFNHWTGPLSWQLGS